MATRNGHKKTRDLDSGIARGNEVVVRLAGGVALGAFVGGAIAIGGALPGAVVGGIVGVFAPDAVSSLTKSRRRSKS